MFQSWPDGGRRSSVVRLIRYIIHVTVSQYYFYVTDCHIHCSAWHYIAMMPVTLYNMTLHGFYIMYIIQPDSCHAHCTTWHYIAVLEVVYCQDVQFTWQIYSVKLYNNILLSCCLVHWTARPILLSCTMYIVHYSLTILYYCLVQCTLYSLTLYFCIGSSILSGCTIYVTDI